jgi:hypothetical protein
LNASALTASTSEVITRLDALAAELAALGWTGHLQTAPGRRPNLHVRNPVPGAAALSEHIYTDRSADGNWTFWWPWADPIASEPAEAAAIIVRVLRAAEAK